MHISRQQKQAKRHCFHKVVRRNRLFCYAKPLGSTFYSIKLPLLSPVAQKKEATAVLTLKHQIALPKTCSLMTGLQFAHTGCSLPCLGFLHVNVSMLFPPAAQTRREPTWHTTASPKAQGIKIINLLCEPKSQCPLTIWLFCHFG